MSTTPNLHTSSPSHHQQYLSSYRPSLPSKPSSNYAQALASSASTSASKTIPSISPNILSDGRKISDGRKQTVDVPVVSSGGEVNRSMPEVIVPSGASAWKPAYVRMQSWNEQDMKREYTMSSLEK